MSQDTHPDYSVRIMGRSILRGRVAVGAFIMLVMFSPLGFFIWIEGASNRRKWLHRAGLALLYIFTYALIQCLRNLP